MKNQILVALRRRVLSNIQFAKNVLEGIFLIDIIVIFEHGEGKGLAKTARPNVEEVFVSLFYILDKRCFVNIVTIIFYHILKVLHTVWYALAIDSLSSFFYYHSSMIINKMLQRYYFYLTKPTMRGFFSTFCFNFFSFSESKECKLAGYATLTGSNIFLSSFDTSHGLAL